MGAIKLKGFASEGKLTLVVPDEFNGQELDVTIETHDNLNDDRMFHEMPVEDRLKVLEQYKGIVKYPDYPIDKYDVYDQ